MRPTVEFRDPFTVQAFVREPMVLQLNSRKVRVYAVKVTGEGWVGVSSTLGRCYDHHHETPELAKLCALHRLQAPGSDPQVVLLPLGRQTREPRG
jgi:hypothetical protein